MGFLQRQAKWNIVAFPIFGAEESGSFSFTSCQIRENSKETSGMLPLSLLEDEVVYGYLIHAYKSIKVRGFREVAGELSFESRVRAPF